MLRILFNPKKAERHPFEIFIIAAVYSSVSILFSLWIFPEYASISMIFLTVFSCIYLVQTGTRMEEERETRSKSERSILKEHSKIIILILCLFLGFTASFTAWSFFLSPEKMSSLFSFQESTVTGIRAAIAGSFSSSNVFLAILLNNIKVLLISLIFALFYGAGALYIIVWNASVMGFVIGNFARQSLGVASLPIAFTKYFIHGIPEMIAYLTTAFAGGLIYVAIWKGDLNSKKRKKIISNVLILIAISLLILIFAGLIEVFISPYI